MNNSPSDSSVTGNQVMSTLGNQRDFQCDLAEWATGASHARSCKDWLPDQMKRLLRISPQMDELLVQSRAFRKNKEIEEGLIVSTMRITRDEMKTFPTGDPSDTITCCHCNGPNHFTKYTGRQTPRIRYYKYDTVGHMSCSFSGNEPDLSTQSAPWALYEWGTTRNYRIHKRS